MKLLTVGDLHYNMPQFDWVMQCAEHYDAVILVGDMLNIAGYVDLDTQIVVVGKYLQRLRERTTVMVCSGNHDLDQKDLAGEYFADWLDDRRLRTLHGDGASVELGGWHFSLCPWWDGPKGQKKVDDFLTSEAGGRYPNWFVIHHAPPDLTRTAWSGKKDFGDAHLRKFIKTHTPKIVLSGHVHQAPFRQENGWYDRIGETWIFNAGYQMGALPPCLVFDLDKMQVIWNSLAGQDCVSLNGEA